MKLEEFKQILQTIYSMDGFRDSRFCVSTLKIKFPNVPGHTLKSIYSQEYLNKMKTNHLSLQASAEFFYENYLSLKHRSDEAILNMAKELCLAPTLLARMILEKHYEKKALYEDDVISSRGSITKMLKDTTLIEDKNLAQQIYMCVLHDDQYGPLADTINHSLGQQYEHKLMCLMKEKNIPFQDEEQLRLLGFDKTPDIKLIVPIAINGFIVNWIESKALFGSEDWHQRFVNKQLSSYCNRFGPGLVIYWFDHIDNLSSTIQNKQIMISNHLPDNIVTMDPLSIGTGSSP